MPKRRCLSIAPRTHHAAAADDAADDAADEAACVAARVADSAVAEVNVFPPFKRRRYWLAAEDLQLKRLVEHACGGDLTPPIKVQWTVLARMMSGRTSKQCRERWFEQIDPRLRADEWTLEEDGTLMAGVAVHSTKWSTIAEMIPHRSANAVRQRALLLKKKLGDGWDCGGALSGKAKPRTKQKPGPKPGLHPVGSKQRRLSTAVTGRNKRPLLAWSEQRPAATEQSEEYPTLRELLADGVDPSWAQAVGLDTLLAPGAEPAVPVVELTAKAVDVLEEKLWCHEKLDCRSLMPPPPPVPLTAKRVSIVTLSDRMRLGVAAPYPFATVNARLHSWRLPRRAA